MPNQHHRAPIQARRSADYGEIVAAHPIPVQLLEVGEHLTDVVQCVWALGMASDLRDLPGVRFAKMLVVSARLFALRRAISSPMLISVSGTQEFELVDLRLELGDRLFEVEKVQVHGRDMLGQAHYQLKLRADTGTTFLARAACAIDDAQVFRAYEALQLAR